LGGEGNGYRMEVWDALWIERYKTSQRLVGIDTLICLTFVLQM